jgi:hypothetical protein
MKKLAIAFFVLASSAMAAERNIYDLMYLPKAGTNFGITEAGLVSGNIEIEALGETYDADLSGSTIRQTVGRSFSDQFAIAINAAYSNLKSDFEESAGSDSDSTTKGLGDPSVEAKYRLVETEITLDVIGELTIGTGDSKIDEDNKANNKQGGPSYFLAVQAGKKINDTQLAVSLGVESYGKQKTDNDGSKTTDDARNEWQMGASALIKAASDNGFIRGSVNAAFDEEYKDNEGEKTASSTTYELTAEYLHVMNANLLITAGITKTQTNSATFEKFEFWGLSASATYQF